LLAAAAVAVAAGVLSATLAIREPRRVAGDVDQLWVAANAWLRGDDPYRAVPAAGWHWPLYYPMPAVALYAPLAPLERKTARVVFESLAAGAMAYAVTGVAWWPLLLVVSGGFLATVAVGQMGTLLVAAALLPFLAALLAVKPSIGLALATVRPDRKLVLAAIVLLVGTLALMPTWPLRWLDAVRHAPHLVAPLLRPGGAVVALAALRWRRAEARLLFVLACVPHTTLPHETLPLCLIAESPGQLAALAASTGAAWLGVHFVAAGAPFDEYLVRAWPWILAFAYLPALWLVLRRPNIPARPAWWGA
jgi:hypothetical protein